MHAVALGPVPTGQEVTNVLYTAAVPHGVFVRKYRHEANRWSCKGVEANHTPIEKEILAAYEGVRAASKVIGTEIQLLLAP